MENGSSVIKFENLDVLFNEMKNDNNPDQPNRFRRQFQITYNEVDADVIFVADTNPFTLNFGIHDKNIFFTIPVERGFLVKTFLDKDLLHLIYLAFEIKYDEDNKFSTKNFIEALSKKMPCHINQTHPTKPIDLAPHNRDVDEVERIYFVSFKNNNTQNHQVRNLDKTLKMMGLEAYEFCKANNMSTCWSDHPNDDRYSNWRNLAKSKI